MKMRERIETIAYIVLGSLLGVLLIRALGMAFQVQFQLGVHP